MSKPMTYDHGDYCLRTSLYTCSILKDLNTHNGKYKYPFHLIDFKAMERECKLSPLSLFPIKSEEYTWSRSDGLTRWLYDHVLKYLKLDLHKGLSGDQLRAYYLYLMLTKQKRKAWLHILGIVLRLGFTPSLMEHCIFKPQAYIALLYTAWKPLKYLSYPFFKLSVIRNLKKPIEQGTTNKILLLPTMYALGMELPKYDYICKVYDTYFSQDDNRFIGISMKEFFKNHLTLTK